MPESSPQSASEFRSNDPFGSTHWSLVLAAGRDGAVARDALETLCRTYWLPVYGFIRRRTRSAHDAQDLTQGFFAALLEEKTFDAADRTRGRFRAFLLTTLKHFLINEHEKAIAQKRGSGQQMFSLDVDEAEKHLRRDAQNQMTPEREYERRWALALLDRVMERLKTEQGAAGRLAHFRALRSFLTGQNAETTYSDVAMEFNITEEAVRAAVYRLRKRYRTLLRKEIAQTVTSSDDVDEELRSLLKALGS